MIARPLTLFAARALTLLRFATIAPFAWLLGYLAENPNPLLGATLVALYLAVVASDFIDGRLARAAGGASVVWGRVDVLADVTFNVASLAVAAAAGVVRAWLPATVALLGARYLFVCFTAGARADLPVDTPGKVAGVLFYAMVGVAVAQVTQAIPGALLTSALGDALAVYGAWLFVRGLGARV